MDETQSAVIYCFDCDLCMCAEVHHIIHGNRSTHRFDFFSLFLSLSLFSYTFLPLTRWFRYSSCNWDPEIFLPGVHHIVAGVAGGVTESLMV